MLFVHGSCFMEGGMWQLNAFVWLGSTLPVLPLTYSHASAATQPGWLEHRAPCGERDRGETQRGPAAFPRGDRPGGNTISC